MDIWSPGAAVAGLIALVEMFFIGIDLLTAALPFLAVAFVAIVGAIAQTVRALESRGKPVEPWCWATAAWFLIAGIALPIALLSLTGDGAIRSC